MASEFGFQLGGPRKDGGSRMRGPATYDPKDKMAFFKDNVVSREELEDVDLTGYIYHSEKGGAMGDMPGSQTQRMAYNGATMPGSMYSGTGMMGATPAQMQAMMMGQPGRGGMMGAPGMASSAAGMYGMGMRPMMSSMGMGGSSSGMGAMDPMAGRQMAMSSMQYGHTQAPGMMMGMTGGPAPMRAVSAASMGPVSVPSSLAPAPASTASTQGPNPGAAFAPEDFPSLGRDSTPLRPSAGQGVIGSSLGMLQSMSQPSFASSPPLIAPSEKFGLMGLLAVIRSSDKDAVSLALGTDLTTLGLNLNSAEPLYASFGCPWSDVPITSKDPVFTLPSCYASVNPVPLKTGHLEKFRLETLFYIFYSMPRDALQWHAAQELYNRKWKYHKDTKMWFANNPDVLKATGAPADAFVAFDVQKWQLQVIPGTAMASVAPGFLAEEELRKAT